jgi:hypothetical protein
MYKITKEMKNTVAKSGLYIPNSMFSIGKDAKTVKGEKLGVTTGVMYLIPSAKLCPSRELAGCGGDCLVTAGRGIYESVHKGRTNKTALIAQHERIALIAIYVAIRKVKAKALKNGTIPSVRLNGTSDIDWTNKRLDGKNMFEHFPEIQFYDYTKVPSIARKSTKYDNYHITVSYSDSPKYMPIFKELFNSGVNIAVVFRNGLPDRFLGLPVVDGDISDLRFFDDKELEGQKIIGLKAKGKARKSDSTFIIDTEKLNSHDDNIIAIAA